MKITHYITIIAGILLLSLFSCEENKSTDIWDSDEEMILTEYLESSRNFEKTLQALKRTYAYNTLSTYGPYTFFCPSDQAWDKFLEKKGYSSIDEIEVDFLESIFEYHILPFEKKLENFENGPMSIADTTINGQRLLLDISGGLDNVIINNKALINNGNVETWNGTIHVINQVLDPPVMTAGEYLRSNAEYSKFVEFLEANDVMDTLEARYASEYPYLSNEFSVFALTNSAMDKLQRSIDSVGIVDERYESEVAKNPEYASRVLPNQVKQLAQSYILSGVNYVSTMYSGYKKTLGQIPYGDGIMRMKVVAGDNKVIINDKASVSNEEADIIVDNGLIHKCDDPFIFLKESPIELIYSAYPIERWNSNLGAMVGLNRKDGYIGDIDNVYGITNLRPERVGAAFWVNIPNVAAGKYNLTLITKKQGSAAKIYTDGKPLIFEGVDDEGAYDFAYVLGNRGRVDSRTPNPCSTGGLYLFEIPAGSFEVSPDQDHVEIKFEVVKLNQGGADIAVSAIILEPLAE